MGLCFYHSFFVMLLYSYVFMLLMHYVFIRCSVVPAVGGSKVNCARPMCVRPTNLHLQELSQEIQVLSHTLSSSLLSSPSP